MSDPRQSLVTPAYITVALCVLAGASPAIGWYLGRLFPRWRARRMTRRTHRHLRLAVREDIDTAVRKGGNHAA